MIVPMKKVCLVVQDRNQNEALTKLREVGVVHVEKTNATSDRLAKVLERKAATENAIGLIQPYKVPKDKPADVETSPKGRRISDRVGLEEDQPYSVEAVNTPTRPHLVDLMVGLGKDRKTLEDRQVFLARERSRIAPWGEFDPAEFKGMAALGLPVFLYELSQEVFSGLSQDVRFIKLAEDKSSAHLMVLDAEIPGITPFQLPEKSLSKIDEEIAEINAKLGELEERLKGFADRRPVLAKEMASIKRDIDFETAKAELEQVEDVPPELSFSYLGGYVPAEDLGRLKAAAAENGWALMADDPGPEDVVPTKLKNNKLVSLLNPLTDFLEVTPGYDEVDISGWFLLFFVIFFGMIFGDAGYGFIILAISLIGIFKTMKKGVPPILRLMLLLGISNFTWGMLTCTWFGVEATKLPAILQKISLPLISNVTSAKGIADEEIVKQNLMIICFTLALVQLSVGHIISITRTKSLKVLGEIGSMLMIAGMYGVILILIASNEYRNLALYVPLMPCVYMLGAGFVLNFVFSSYEGSIGKSILESLKNIISMILGIANVFSDIMSYIRLWAVGLAGAAIASTVVTMAGPMLGHFIFFIFGILLLVFGHGLNFVLSVLSVLVHGVRLNTLEFSGHVGLTWAGSPYRPFSDGKGGSK
ncbi:MAG: V-type ATP synthase subunit I [Treponema sp.]|nr:V-type ATP synthase subunit I [Treponema sp.]